MKNLKIGLKMTILTLVSCTAFILSFILTDKMSEPAEIGGSTYSDIILANELTADILPPPEYIIESFAYALRLYYTEDSVEEDEIAAAITRLKSDYDMRNVYWQTAFPEQDDSVYKTFVTDAYKYGSDFFVIVSDRLIPADKANDEAAMREAMDSAIEAYENHRECIDQTVIYAADFAERMTVSGGEMIANRDRGLLIVLVVSLLIIALLCIAISVSVAGSLTYGNKVIGKIAGGDLSIVIDEKYISRDEAGGIVLGLKNVSAMLRQYKAYLGEVSDSLHEMADGNINVALKEKYTGDFAVIKTAFEEFQTMFGDTLSRIKSASNAVGSGSKTFAENSAALAADTNTQAASIRDLSGNSETLSMISESNAELSGKALSMINEAASEADRCGENVSQMFASMSEIKTMSDEMVKTIKAIEDIAFQTNILALNASVEAARAGEAGKGFAVVASEVRNLATRSAEASKNTSDIINSTGVKISDGMNVADRTKTSVESILSHITSVSGLISDLSETAENQKKEVTDINNSVSAISVIIDRNSTAAEESAASSQELNAVAVELMNTVERFS
ncbi:MAG: methyl-accepting chemotaxis protein [Ruminococcus sp.]|jgi:methyl-accepting chemotaxis protein|nr:methyl-accepting chemotaxis protein [Ruminococcus sp.]